MEWLKKKAFNTEIPKQKQIDALKNIISRIEASYGEMNGATQNVAGELEEKTFFIVKLIQQRILDSQLIGIRDINEIITKIKGS